MASLVYDNRDLSHRLHTQGCWSTQGRLFNLFHLFQRSLGWWRVMCHQDPLVQREIVSLTIAVLLAWSLFPIDYWLWTRHKADQNNFWFGLLPQQNMLLQYQCCWFATSTSGKGFLCVRCSDFSDGLISTCYSRWNAKFNSNIRRESGRDRPMLLLQPCCDCCCR